MVSYFDKLIEKLADWFMVFFTDPDYALQPAFVTAGAGYGAGNNDISNSDQTIAGELLKLKKSSKAIFKFFTTAFLKAENLEQKDMTKDTKAIKLKLKPLPACTALSKISRIVQHKIHSIKDAADRARALLMQQPDKPLSLLSNVHFVNCTAFLNYRSLSIFAGSTCTE